MRVARIAKPALLTSLLCVCPLATSSALGSPTATTLAVTVAGSPVTTITSGTAITLTAAVLAGSTPVAPGTVNFCDATATYCTDIHILGTAQLTAAGTATTRFVPPVGSHSYKAVFVGTNTNEKSNSAAATLSVTPSLIRTYTTIAQSGTASGYTLTATVAQAGMESTPAPRGTVSFLDQTEGSALVGTGELGAVANGLNYWQLLHAGLQQPELVGDFNGDGIPDLLVISKPYIQPAVAVYLGDGTGRFNLAPSVFPITSEYGLFAAGDFNGDGKLDVAFMTSAATGQILLGNGDGTFTASPTPLPTGTDKTSAAVGDFNGDGNLDLALVSTGGSYGKILLGNGDGTFTAFPHYLTTTTFARGIAVADFNGDGKADLAIYEASGEVGETIFLGNGDGTFKVLSPIANGGLLDAVADFNGDGIPDLALFQPGSDNVYHEEIFLGKGEGTFSQIASLSSPTGYLTSSVLGDFNGDGKPDLASVSDYTSPDTLDPNFNLVTFLGSGDGTFTTAPLAPLPYTAGILVADFNGDGLSDALAFNQNNEASTFLAVNQTATATATGVMVPPSSGTDHVIAKYPGDSNHQASLSYHTALEGRTVSLTPSELSFLPTEVGKTDGYQKLTLTNTSGSVLDIASIAITNTQSHYSWGIREQTCGSTLAAGVSCTFDVAFRPTTLGHITADITIVDDAKSSPQTVPLGGNGVSSPIPQVVVFPTVIAFSPTDTGAASGYQVVFVSNNGVIPLNVESIEVTNTKDFYSWGIRENTCTSVPLYGNCSFSVVFRPTHAGSINADIRIKDNANSSP